MTVTSELDHLVVTAPSLAVGRAWAEERLGIALQPGGRHERMGTHNALLRLGPACYLEVIAVDPEAPRPDRPRWFDLDALRPGDAPRLATWVARTQDLEAAVAACPVSLGDILRMRRGDLTWRITVPPDGSLPWAGALPTLIAWDDEDAHPAGRLEDRGCSLVELAARVRPGELVPVQGALGALGLAGALGVGPVDGPGGGRLSARIATPAGLRTL